MSLAPWCLPDSNTWPQKPLFLSQVPSLSCVPEQAAVWERQHTARFCAVLMLLTAPGPGRHCPWAVLVQGFL